MTLIEGIVLCVIVICMFGFLSILAWASKDKTYDNKLSHTEPTPLWTYEKSKEKKVK